MKRALALVIVAGTLVAAAVALSQSFSVPLGSTKGPQQPVAFPHDLHAGKLGMDCLYCHPGAAKSPVASLPAVSTCMGCHTMAVTDRPEVQKLSGFAERGEPIPWVEVYKLPDYVKFNHKRHVKSGIACQSCHGPVQEMKTVYQYSSLKMGWCVSCHRSSLKEGNERAPMDCIVCHH